MRRFVISALSLLAVPFALAQAVPPHPATVEETGTVTGQVLCGDSQRPARLASVRLVPTSIAAADPTAKPNAFADSQAMGSSIPPVQTDMNGMFTARNVKPGSYFLRVEYEGYLTPMLSFTREQLAHPTPDVRQRIASELQVITVAPHATTKADTTIQRGAVVSGTVLYDDGSPAVGVPVMIFRRNSKGEFKDQFNSGLYNSPTDDRGRFRIDSLPNGDFVLQAEFSMSESVYTTMPSPAGMGGGTVELHMQKTIFSLPVFSGSALRLRDAKPVTLQAGAESPSNDLTMPLSKLHDVSGSVLSPGGSVVNAGKVKLLYADNREELTEAPVSRADGQFHFPYIPEGDYILSVEDPKDVTEIQVPNAKGITPAFHSEDKTVRHYGPAEQPLMVSSDMQSVLVKVTELKAAQ